MKEKIENGFIRITHQKEKDWAKEIRIDVRKANGTPYNTTVPNAILNLSNIEFENLCGLILLNKEKIIRWMEDNAQKEFLKKAYGGRK